MWMGLTHKVRPNKCCVQKKQPRKNCKDNVRGENPGDPGFGNDFRYTKSTIHGRKIW